MSDLDELAEVELPGGDLPAASGDITAQDGKKASTTKKKEVLAQAKAAHGFSHLSGCRKATIRLIEMGPRLTLQLIKVSF